MEYTKIYTILFSSIIVVNCTSTKRIQKSMNMEQGSLAYIHESAIVDEKNDQKVFFNNIEFFLSNLPETAEVVRKKNLVLPFLFFNAWDSQNECILGRSNIKEDIPSFISQAFKESVDRSGNFSLSDSNNEDYKLKITIDSLYASGPYRSGGTVIFLLIAYSYSYWEVAGPGLAFTRMSYELSKNDSVVLNDVVRFRSITEQINKPYGSNDRHLQRDFTTSLIEALSTNIRKSIETIISDVNECIGFISEEVSTLETSKQEAQDSSISPIISKSLLTKSKSIKEPIYNTPIVLYRRGKSREREEPIQFSIDGNVITDFRPNSYKELSLVTGDSIKICYGNNYENCQDVALGYNKVHYYNCSFSKKELNPSFTPVDPSKGEFESITPYNVQQKRQKKLNKKTKP